MVANCPEKLEHFLLEYYHLSTLQMIELSFSFLDDILHFCVQAFQVTGTGRWQVFFYN
jgi:hypothetical protein